MVTAHRELALARLFVVYPGTRQFELGDGITALPLGALATALRGLRPRPELTDT